MRLTQAWKVPSPRKSLICSKAERKASWARSSARAGSAPIRRSRARTAEAWRRTSSPNGVRPPAAAMATSSRSWAEARPLVVSVIANAPVRQLATSGLGRAAAGHIEDEVRHADQAGNGAGAGDRATGDVGGDVADA